VAENGSLFACGQKVGETQAKSKRFAGIAKPVGFAMSYRVSCFA
jgi:hypothetical protein